MKTPQRLIGEILPDLLVKVAITNLKRLQAVKSVGEWWRCSRIEFENDFNHKRN